MTAIAELKRERDRFVAFSFAAADLLLEVGADGKILYVSGAARAVCGQDAGALIGQPYDLLFAEGERAMIRRRLDRIGQRGRLAPIAVRLSPQVGPAREMLLGGCRLPSGPTQFYLTLSPLRAAQREDPADTDPETQLLDPAKFQERAADALRRSAEQGSDLGLTLMQVAGFEQFSRAAGNDATDRFLTEIGSLLRACAVDGGTAGRVAEDKYGVVHGGAFDPAVLDAKVEAIARAAAPAVAPPTVARNSVELCMEALSEEEAVRALIFTIGSFGKSSGSFSITSLAGGFDELLRTTVTKFKAYKEVVAENRFSLAFQPIVDLASGSVRHFEVLSRLEDGRSPYHMVTFAEELGIIEQFDLMVCRRALEFLAQEGGGPLTRIAINLSAQSVEHPLFVSTLLELLAGTRVEDKLLFEITESTQIKDLARTNAAIQRLRERRFQVGLDDFGAGAASFPYLQALSIDFVKIDGAYVREVLSDERSALILRAMCGLCRDLGLYTIGEMVETREQVDKLRDLGVDCGQGYFFGRPGPTIVPPETTLEPAGGDAKVLSQRRVYQVWGQDRGPARQPHG